MVPGQNNRRQVVKSAFKQHYNNDTNCMQFNHGMYLDLLYRY